MGEGFISEYRNEVDTIFSLAQQNAVSKLSDIKLEDIKVPNNVGILNEVPASVYDLETKVLGGPKEEIGLEDLFECGTISLAMKKQYEGLKEIVENHNKDLPEYSSGYYSTYLPKSENEKIYDHAIDQQRIDNYDDYINKKITASNFEYETKGERNLSLTVDLIPYVGAGKLLLEVLMGKDLVTGRTLSTEERLIMLGTMGIVSLIKPVYKSIKAGRAAVVKEGDV
jgi:hypothetical protein